jgi:hypothetical protein
MKIAAVMSTPMAIFFSLESFDLFTELVIPAAFSPLLTEALALWDYCFFLIHIMNELSCQIVV